MRGAPSGWWLFASVLVQAAVAALVAWLVSRRTPVAPAPRSEDSLLTLAQQLEPPLRKLFGQLEAELQRAREVTAQAEQLVAQLQRRPAPAPPVSVEDAPSPSLEARAEARRLLGEGHEPSDVAEATGLPLGEVQVLANLLRVRETGPADEPKA